MRVRWLKEARADLDSIRAFYAALNPETAKRYRARIMKRASELQDFPFLGPSIDEPSGTRALVVGKTPFVIVYRITPAYVLIEAIFDARQDR